MSLKSTGDLCVMIMENDAKLKEEMTCRFKIDARNFTHLTRALESLKRLYFDWLF